MLNAYTIRTTPVTNLNVGCVLHYLHLNKQCFPNNYFYGRYLLIKWNDVITNVKSTAEGLLYLG